MIEAKLERYAEPLAALVPGADWPSDAFERAWRLLLWNGAHDSVCGCSHDQVARDVDARHDEAEGLVDEAIVVAAGRLAAMAAQPGNMRWNPSPFEREGIPGLGWAVRPPGSSDPDPCRPADGGVDGHRIELDDGIVLSFTDEDDVGDLYTFCPPDGGAAADPTSVDRAGPGRFVVRFDGCTIELVVTRRDAEPFMRLDGRLDNARPDHRLRLRVALGTTPSGSTAMAPFEIVARPLIGEGYAFETGSPTWPARGSVLAADLAVMAEGVFEYEVAGDQLAITLLRAIGIISQPTLATRPIDAGPGTLTPDAQCLGKTRFALGVWPDARADALVAMWERFALPILERPTTGAEMLVGLARHGDERIPGGEVHDHGRLLQIDDAQLSSIRRVNGAVEVRVWNDGAQSRNARIGDRTVQLGPAAIETIRLEPSGR